MAILTDVITVWPEVTGTDGDGNPVKVPGPSPVQVLGSMQPVSAEESAALGQALTTTYRFYSATSFPGGASAKVSWAGRDWDIVGEPQRRPGGAAANDTVLLRARSPETPPAAG